ncbi:MAG TPA: tetratricopeptide repeat protein [Smithella sp.]|nr:tetratricopeptide repeat protein [Smithella sp.]
MSYINDALLKAQKEKNSPYAAYETTLKASGKNINRPRIRLLPAGILIFLFLTAGMIVLLYWHGEKKMPAAAPLSVSHVQSIVPARPQVVQSTIPDNKSKTGSNTAVSAKVKIGRDNADARILYAQAIKKQEEGNLDEAKSIYKKVIKIDPRNIQALNNLGVIYMNKKKYKWAIIRLNDALKVKYNYPDAHYNLACLYAQKNDEAKSLSYLRNAIGFNPEVRKWAKDDNDLKVWADLPEFKKLLEKK